jgi:hypothetical protein
MNLGEVASWIFFVVFLLALWWVVSKLSNLWGGGGNKGGFS